MTKILQKILYTALILLSTGIINGCKPTSYPEYQLAPLPASVSHEYLRNSLLYTSLSVVEEDVVAATLARNSNIEHKLMTFSKERVRVLMVYDIPKNTHIINIASLQNGYDITTALHKYLVNAKFPFQINGFYSRVYDTIREEIITSIRQGSIVQINAIGSATAYSTLLALELRQMQIPVESVVNFGSARFASQDAHEYIASQLEGIMVNVTHENDINHLIYMGLFTADSLPNEYIICNTPKCSEKIYEQRIFFKNEIRKHISSYPRQYIAMYHDSLIKPQS